jgi:homogentisate 1,2-dioxygenase
MLHRHTLGKIPPKPHIAFSENDRLLLEVCVTREGFHGPFSMLYYRRPPTDETTVKPLELPGFAPYELAPEQPLARRHVQSQSIQPGGDYLSARRTLFVNDDVHMGVLKPTEATTRWFSNGDGDELYFVNDGAGVVESIYGVLPFQKHDYLLIPKATPYRLVFEPGPTTLLVFEGRPKLDIPSDYRNPWGQLSDFAPYTHRDFRLPQELLSYDAAKHGEGPFQIVSKRDDRLTIHMHETWPHDVAGWDGILYPVAFSIHDFQPKTGLVHLPPTIHVTFSGPGFVVCSFVPRIVDFHPQAVPCPYGHASADMDEILYYVEGNFTSRKGIGPESISLHPAGVPHGPHPGQYEKSIGVTRTNELAVMCDTYKTLRMTTAALELEDTGYHTTWNE